MLSPVGRKLWRRCRLASGLDSFVEITLSDASSGASVLETLFLERSEHSHQDSEQFV